ncbi:unnamed protein product [Rotaria magnacalcarata]|uniref:G-protein coupled receptors family 1 profile domain-containing protein n=1 Tax=Rotaria magnacalcarata TaxID=392030 RepID=A0A819BTN2_9BILA|nr:unnamed protein product [Rotaria magnacalcarata]CAF3954765.1 unnamed protein product [Rotaria magnacalcarata]CAF3990289.1 unnamed protein product [Rotaria magnacalcarata]CAF4072996.1 unnamed protein product [Rotaria magnacalcarata]CAF4086940.1 unnamed protein product [Rotaria magnacalcarata]
MSTNFNNSGYNQMSLYTFVSHLAKTSAITTASTTDAMPLENRPSIMVTFISLYALIFFFGICGNALVVLVVCRNKAMQTVTNVFITNLALSDILVIYVSTLTSLAIAVDRYFVIVHPFRSRMRLGVCILLIIVIWIVGISISLPLAIYMRFDRTKCEEYWPQYTSRRFFNFSSLILQYLIPFSVISFSYYKVWVALARRSLPGRTRIREEVEICRKKRTNRMLIAMVVIFAICWLPLNIVHMVAEFHRSQLSHYKVLFLSTHVIAMSSTIYNPFLYSWLNDNFRKEFQKIVPCLFKVCCCLNRRQSNNLSTQLTNMGDADFYDRPSTYQIPAESTIGTSTQNYSQMKQSTSNGKLNGLGMKKINNQETSFTVTADEASFALVPLHRHSQITLSTSTNIN